MKVGTRMSTKAFPLNYFAAMAGPVSAFKERQPLKLRQTLAVILLIISVMILPIAVKIGQLKIVSLDQFASQSMALLDDQVAEQLSHYATGPNGQLVMPSQDISLRDDDQGRVLLLAQDDSQQLEASLAGKAGVAFTPERFVVTAAGNRFLSQPYDPEADFRPATSADSLNRLLSGQWFQNNRLAIILTIFINSWLLLAVSFLIMLFGVAGFLSFMKFTDIFSIKSYGQAFRVCLNCFGWPTLVAVLVGFVTGNPAHVLTGLGIAFMAMIMWVYWTTHFQDAYVEAKLAAQEDN